MEASFNNIFSEPENEIFRVVFYPDRIYHAAYLNATRSGRYRYNVREVRNALNITVLKGQVYIDDQFVTNFLRIEYKPNRLVESAREQNRFIRQNLRCKIRLLPEDRALNAEAEIRLHYCPWIDSFQVEVWGTLEPPQGSKHDYKVLDMMGKDGSITRIRELTPALGNTDTELKALKELIP